MKKLIAITMAAVLLLAMVVSAPVAAARGGSGGINDPPGNPLYVIIEVTWDGVSANGDWTVWGPVWAPVVGTGPVLASCTNCLDMSSYTFTFHGKTVHFDEVMVSSVRATPQQNHVVLKDIDGDLEYTGSLAAGHYFAWAPEPDGSWAIHYFDRIDYEITFDSIGGNVTSFRYLQYEHKKL
ncbi:hypothetical protein ES703_76390 [subsurface metagenome]